MAHLVHSEVFFFWLWNSERCGLVIWKGCWNHLLQKAEGLSDCGEILSFNCEVPPFGNCESEVCCIELFFLLRNVYVSLWSLLFQNLVRSESPVKHTVWILRNISRFQCKIALQIPAGWNRKLRFKTHYGENILVLESITWYMKSWSFFTSLLEIVNIRQIYENFFTLKCIKAR